MSLHYHPQLRVSICQRIIELDGLPCRPFGLGHGLPRGPIAPQSKCRIAPGQPCISQSVVLVSLNGLLVILDAFLDCVRLLLHPIIPPQAIELISLRVICVMFSELLNITQITRRLISSIAWGGIIGCNKSLTQSRKASSITSRPFNETRTTLWLMQGWPGAIRHLDCGAIGPRGKPCPRPNGRHGRPSSSMIRWQMLTLSWGW